MATLKNVTQEVIKFSRKYIGYYDAAFLLGLAAAFLTPAPFSSFYLGIAAYGAINAVVKNARPDLTVIVANKDTHIVE